MIESSVSELIKSGIMKYHFARAVVMVFIAGLSSSSLFSQDDSRIDLSTRIAYDRKPAFVFITEIAGGTGISLTDVPYAKYFYGINASAGYQFTENIKAGMGTGFHIHNEGIFLPLYLDTRFSLDANEFVPYFGAAGGLTFNLSDPGNRVWLYINPSLGVRWVAADRRSFSFSAGLMTMSGSISRNSFITFRLGIELKGK